MLSAITMEKEREFEPDRVYDDYMIKPLDLRQMLEKFQTLLDIKWTTGVGPDAPPPPPAAPPQNGKRPPLGEIEALIHLGQIGHVRGINAKLAEIETNSPGARGIREGPARHRQFVQSEPVPDSAGGAT